MQITLDDTVIFRGEIQRAVGTTATDPDNCCECILFTTNSTILGLIEKYDPVAQQAIKKKQEADLLAATSKTSRRVHWGYAISNLDSDQDNKSQDFSIRPNSGSNMILGDDLQNRSSWVNDNSIQRPTTGRSKKLNESSHREIDHFSNLYTGNDASKGSNYKNFGDDSDVLSQSLDFDKAFNCFKESKLKPETSRPQSTQISMRARPSTAALARTTAPVAVNSSIELFLLSSWGDPQWIGMSGLCGIDSNLDDFTLPVPETYYYSYSVDGHSDLSRISIIDNCNNLLLVNNSKLTSKYEDMWVCAQHRKLVVGIKFLFTSRVSMKGIRIWNFNAGKEDACIGVKHMEISIDGNRRKAVIVRKAPGDCGFDYSQFLPVCDGDTGSLRHNQFAKPQFKSSNSFDQTFSNEVGNTKNFNDLEYQKKTIESLGISDGGAVVDDDYLSDQSDSFDKDKNCLVSDSMNFENSVCLLPQKYVTPVIYFNLQVR